MSTATRNHPFHLLAAALLCLAVAVGVASTAQAAPTRSRLAPLTSSIQSPPKVRDQIHILQAYVASIQSEDFTGDTPYVRVVVTADDPHDTLLVYATSKPCATTPQAAMNMVEYGTDGALIADVDIGAGGLHLAWYYYGHKRYTYELEGFNQIPVQPGQYSTVCAMLFDATGDPPQSGYPHGIKQNHVWKTAQTPLPTGAPTTSKTVRMAAADARRHSTDGGEPPVARARRTHVKIDAALLSPLSAAPQEDQMMITVSVAHPEPSTDALLLYLTRTRCEPTYRAAEAYLDATGLSAFVSEHPTDYDLENGHVTTTVGWSTGTFTEYGGSAATAYTTVCALDHTSKDAGADGSATAPAYATLARASRAITHGPATSGIDAPSPAAGSSCPTQAACRATARRCHAPAHHAPPAS